MLLGSHQECLMQSHSSNSGDEGLTLTTSCITNIDASKKSRFKLTDHSGFLWRDDASRILFYKLLVES